MPFELPKIRSPITALAVALKALLRRLRDVPELSEGSIISPLEQN